MARLTFACIAGLLSIVAFAQGPAFAAEIRLLTAGAMRAVVIELLPEFESKTGHKVSIDNATAGTLAKRIEGGEAFDVAIITPKIVDDLDAEGKNRRRQPRGSRQSGHRRGGEGRRGAARHRHGRRSQGHAA